MATNQRLKAPEDVRAETSRFLKKLEEAINEEPEDAEQGHYWAPPKKWASVKRLALDVKNELSKITTFTRH